MQLRAERTRRAILKAARKLFAAGGFSGTSVDAIALTARVNKQRIYAYFGSKKQLFEAVLLEVFSESAARFEEFAAGVDCTSGDVTGMLVQYYRKLRGLTQEAFADEIGKSWSFVAKVESPTRPFGVSMETLFKISEVLDVPVSKFFEH